MVLYDPIIKTDCMVENKEDISYISHLMAAFNNNQQLTKENFRLIHPIKELVGLSHGLKTITV